ncbi:MAG: DUF296 domain-containing protein [Candidatus Altiarchaeota archaeon]
MARKGRNFNNGITSTNVKSSEEFLGRFEHDTEVMTEIREFASRKRVKSAVFSMIGAVKSATISYYDQKARKYHDIEFNEPMEVVHCTGNICIKDGKSIVHAHACLAHEDGRAVGGHLVAMRVFAGEIHIKIFRNKIIRAFDEKTGLNLLDLS